MAIKVLSRPCEILELQLFYKDTGDKNEDIESTDCITGSNTGLSMLGTYITGSQELTMSGNLFKDVFQMDRY